MTAIPTHPTDGPIHTAFGLTYANYLTLPRTLLQSMPIEWQERFVACLDEFHAAFAHVEQAEAYAVSAGTEHIVSEMADFQLAWAGVAVDYYGGEEPPEGLDEEGLAAWQEKHETEPTYHHIRDGREMDSGERVILPGDDPVPHYNRGRTYIEPAAEHLAKRASAIAAGPPRPSDKHSAIYVDQHNQSVWSDYPTVPPGDDVLPMVWASEVTTSRAGLAERGVELRVVAWIE